jgi:DNA invertase Pin-like site-specific DNA recombinase
VSTKEQADEGNSLVTQERICKDYAYKNEFAVVKVFVEYGESAKTADRTKLQEMLKFVSDSKNDIGSVIIYKLDRLSRNTDDYSNLRVYLRKFGVDIKSVTEAFEDNPAGRLYENMMANFAQFDNDVRAERCSGGMKEAIREGRYVWGAPVGYTNGKVNDKSNISKSEMSDKVKESFEFISKGIYPVEVVRKMMTDRGLRLPSGKALSKQYFYKMLKNKVYCGVIEKFGEVHKGIFEPIVTEELFNTVQFVLKNKGRKNSQYKLDREDFPLRRFVYSPEGKKLTGSWSKGRTSKHPYYRFGVKGSNYNRDNFEMNFMNYMNHYRVTEELRQMIKEEVRRQVEEFNNKKDDTGSDPRVEISKLKEKQNLLVEKNLNGILSDGLLKDQLEKIEGEIVLIQANIVEKEEKVNIDVDEVFSFVEDYLNNPGQVWKNSSLEKKLKLQWFQFPKGVSFDGNNYGTEEISLLFKRKDAFSASLSPVVDSSLNFSYHLYKELSQLCKILSE